MSSEGCLPLSNFAHVGKVWLHQAQLVGVWTTSSKSYAPQELCRSHVSPQIRRYKKQNKQLETTNSPNNVPPKQKKHLLDKSTKNINEGFIHSQVTILEVVWTSIPIRSMGLVYTYIYHKKSTMHGSVNIPCMDLVGGWTNPFEKYARQIGSFPHKIGVNI